MVVNSVDEILRARTAVPIPSSGDSNTAESKEEVTWKLVSSLLMEVGDAMSGVLGWRMGQSSFAEPESKASKETLVWMKSEQNS